MRPKLITYALAALDRNGICQSQDPAAAGYLTINGALASSGAVTNDSPRHVAIYGAGDESAHTFTITGTDRQDDAMTEDITGPNATTTAGSKNFKTITAVYVDGNSGAVEVGTYSSAETGWIVVPYSGVNSYAVDVAFTTMVTDHEIQYTLDDPYGSSFDESTANAYAITDYSLPVRAIRVEVSNLTTGGTMYVRIAVNRSN